VFNPFVAERAVQSTHTCQYRQNPLQNMVLDAGSVLGLLAVK